LEADPFDNTSGSCHALLARETLAESTATDSQSVLRLTRYVLAFTIAAVVASATQVVVALCK